MDGTILDTLQDIAISTNYVLDYYNFPKRTVLEVKSFVGNGMEKLIQRAVPAGTDEKLVQKVLKDFKQHYAEHCKDNTAPYFGINELLWNLRNVGIKTAKNAGVDCISVSWGFREKKSLPVPAPQKS
ncbi:MAG: HAD hydrolase-like protein [Treponema sp.]|nr:HAD hydrolase-like protein [Treponema sp.]